jgi:nitrogen fixation/metabolism regulation signal transduction histidine kinase
LDLLDAYHHLNEFVLLMSQQRLKLGAALTRAQNSERRLQLNEAVLAAAQISVLMVDSKGMIVSASQSCGDLWRVPTHSLLGASFARPPAVRVMPTQIAA